MTAWLLKDGDSGARVKDAQLLLSGKSTLGVRWYTGPVDGLFGPLTGAAAKRCKFDLGYQDAAVLPTFGPTLRAYLLGKQLPAAYEARQKARAVPALVQPIPAAYSKGQNAVHPTAGLPDYPAIDFFADPGSPVVAPERCLVARFSGHDPAQGPVSGPHGPFAWSMYLTGTASGTSYYMTHLESRTVTEGGHVEGGAQVGTVADYAKWTGTPCHTHVGVHGGSVSIGMLAAATLA